MPVASTNLSGRPRAARYETCADSGSMHAPRSSSAISDGPVALSAASTTSVVAPVLGERRAQALEQHPAERHVRIRDDGHEADARMREQGRRPCGLVEQGGDGVGMWIEAGGVGGVAIRPRARRGRRWRGAAKIRLTSLASSR